MIANDGCGDDDDVYSYNVLQSLNSQVKKNDENVGVCCFFYDFLVQNTFSLMKKNDENVCVCCCCFYDDAYHGLIPPRRSLAQNIYSTFLYVSSSLIISFSPHHQKMKLACFDGDYVVHHQSLSFQVNLSQNACPTSYVFSSLISYPYYHRQRKMPFFLDHLIRYQLAMTASCASSYLISSFCACLK